MLFHNFDKFEDNGDTRGFSKYNIFENVLYLKIKRAMKSILTAYFGSWKILHLRDSIQKRTNWTPRTNFKRWLLLLCSLKTRISYFSMYLQVNSEHVKKLRNHWKRDFTSKFCYKHSHKPHNYLKTDSFMLMSTTKEDL